MIKQTWNIDENERFRILNLHESATKKHYLVKEELLEQSDDEDEMSQSPKDMMKRAKAANWKGTWEGMYDFGLSGPGAKNVGPKSYLITHFTSSSGVGAEIKKNEEPGKVTPSVPQTSLAEFTVAGSSLPYADNMVKPYFDKFPDALNTFNTIVKKFVDYIKIGGGPNLTNVTIKGSADSAAPTTQVPAGYTALDHPSSKPFNGLTDPKQMNQYLADTRASEYAKVLSAKIKELTGFDLKITVLPGDNYYGQEGKRGIEYRSITLNPNAGPITTPDTKPSGPDSETKSKTSVQRSENQNKSVMVKFGLNGKRYQKPGYIVKDKSDTFVGFSRKDIESMGIPLDPVLFKGSKNAKITEDNKFYVDGVLMGDVKTVDEDGVPPQGSNNPSPTPDTTIGAWVGPVSKVWGYGTYDVPGEGSVNVGFILDVYFLIWVSKYGEEGYQRIQ